MCNRFGRKMFTPLVYVDSDSGTAVGTGGIPVFVRRHPEVHLAVADPGGRAEGTGDHGKPVTPRRSGGAYQHADTAGDKRSCPEAYVAEGLPLREE